MEKKGNLIFSPRGSVVTWGVTEIICDRTELSGLEENAPKATSHHQGDIQFSKLAIQVPAEFSFPFICAPFR